MYEYIIKEYIKKLSINDIDNFAIKNNIILKKNENIIIYNYIKDNWKRILYNDTSSFLYLKNNLSIETYNNVLSLYNRYKEQFNL